MDHKIKKLKILSIGFDWNGIGRGNYEKSMEKLNRDGLNTEFNDVFIIYAGSRIGRDIAQKDPEFLAWHFNLLVKNRILYDVFFIFALPLALLYEKFRPDIFYFCDFAHIISAIIPAKILRSKIYFRLYNLPTQLALSKGRIGKIYYLYYRVAEKLLYRFVDQFIAINNTTKKYLMDLGVKEEKIILNIPNTIARDEEYIKSADEKIIRKKYSISPDKKIIISIGSLIKEKGFDQLIKAFAGLKRDDLILAICGKGPEEEKLKKLSFNFGISKRVIFAGLVDRKDIWGYLLGSDIFMLFSKSESLGMVFWEAMYAGLPVIGTPVGGVKETIGDDGKRGFYWNNDIENFSEKIDFCLNDKYQKEREELINRAKKFVIERMKQKININEIFNLK